LLTDIGRLYGDIVLELESVLEIRLPSSQLVGNQVTINRDGILTINQSTTELNVNVIQGINANDMLMLGRQFFSAAMLMINQDTNSVTLWEATATARQNLVAVDPAGVGMSASCDNVVSNNTWTIIPTTQSDVPASENTRSASGVSVTTIEAIVGGAAALLALIIVLPTSFKGGQQRQQLRKRCRMTRRLTLATMKRSPITHPKSTVNRSMNSVASLRTPTCTKLKVAP
jgi:hypothetical protein